MSSFKSSPPLASLAIALLFAISTMATLAACGSNGDTGSNNDFEVDPQITITSPEPGSIHSQSQINVTGTAEHTDEVDVNGTTVPVVDDEWEVELSFEDGEVTATASAGPTETSVEFIVDTQPPQIIIDTPQPGLMVDDENDDGQGSIVVTGELASVGPSGLEFFFIAGTALDIEEGDSFEHTVTLREGLNLIEFTAVDVAHNELTKHRAVIFGPLTDPDSPIDEALRADLFHPSGINAIAEVVESFLSPTRLDDFLGSDLELGDGISVEIHELTWDEVDVDLSPRDDSFIRMQVSLKDLFFAGAFSYGSADPINGDISIGEVTLTLDVFLTLLDDNEIDIDIVDNDLELEDTTVNIEGEESDEAALLLAGAIKMAFQGFMEELFLDDLYDPDMLSQEFELLGRTITLDLLLEEIFIGPGGLIGRMGMVFPGDKSDLVPDVPGALHRSVQGSPGGGLARHVVLYTNRTVLERVVHALWQSGLFHLSIGEGEGADIPFELNANILAMMLDHRIRDIHDEDTPAQMRLRPMLPPVIEFDSEDDMTAGVGDFLVDFYLSPDDAADTLVLTLSLQLLINLEYSGGIDDLDVEIDVEAHIADEPLFSFDPDDTIGLVTKLLTLMPDSIISDLSIEPEASLEWLSIVDPQIEFDEDLMSIGVNIEPADDATD